MSQKITQDFAGLDWQNVNEDLGSSERDQFDLSKLIDSSTSERFFKEWDCYLHRLL